MNDLKAFLPYLFGNKEGRPYRLPSPLKWEDLNFEATLMFHALENSLGSFCQTLDLSHLTLKEALHLFSFEHHLPRSFKDQLIAHFKEAYDHFKRAQKGDPLSSSSLQELLNFSTGKTTLFAILHSDRKKPGRLFLRNVSGDFLHEGGKVWSLPILGLSGRGLAFHHSNGCTPCGVMTVDSVMPEANKVREFGTCRRLIVNFIRASADESEIKKDLPSTHHHRAWWRQAFIAREMGRSLLRIHGTGRVNKNPFSPFYPMVPTSGCLATTEMSFWGQKKVDQRVLLDALMEASGLSVSYENESKIQALLYVVEFDGTYQSLEFRG